MCSRIRLVTKSSHSKCQTITTLAIPQLLLYFGLSDQRLLPESLWLPPKLSACFFTITSLQSIFSKTVRLILLKSMCDHVPPQLTYIFLSKSQSPCKNLEHQGFISSLLQLALLSHLLTQLYNISLQVSQTCQALSYFKPVEFVLLFILVASRQTHSWLFHPSQVLIHMSVLHNARSGHTVHFHHLFLFYFCPSLLCSDNMTIILQKHFFICKVNEIDCRNWNNEASWCYQQEF